ncbi:MAG TPA: cytochrome d ubiquinol oxidase subunit II [Reyranella sp.]|nr:cytochrome d ubiquinol oxidase subunit II [Reyranella sp.]
MLATYLPVIWALLIATAVALYVILDGFDLGLGILFQLEPKENCRDLMMNSVAPFWDGNETWLVLGGAGLLVAFPLAYAVIMPGLYLPIIIMLLGLVFRGVAFEFRWAAKPSHEFWDNAFSWGSIVATFMQGVVLGGYLQGIEVKDKAFAGGSLDWLAPFPLFTGVALLGGYALLGATWLVMKIDGPLAEDARGWAKKLLPAVLVIMAIISVWTPLAFERIADRWFAWPNILYLSPVPIATAILAWACWHGLNTGREVVPFLCAVGLFLLGFVGLAISNVPYLVPPSITIWEAAAVPQSQIFTLIGVLIMLPVILGYTVFVYWTFRGKVREGEGYH